MNLLNVLSPMTSGVNKSLVNLGSAGINATANVVKRKKKRDKARNATRMGESVAGRVTMGTKLSEPAKKFLEAIRKPMSMVQCVGSLYPPATPSFKNKAFVRGVFNTNTSGVGFVCVSPCLSNNAPCVFYTNASTTATTFELPTSASANGVIASTLGTGVNTAGLTTGGIDEICGRIVLASLRVRYVGPKLYEGGVQYGYVEPAHHTISGMNASNLASKLECQRLDVKRSDLFQQIVAVPYTAHERSYYEGNSYPDVVYTMSQGASETAYAASGGGGSGTSAFTVGCPILGVMVDSSSVGSQSLSFEFEYVQYSEYVGPGLNQWLLTPSAADYAGATLLETAVGVARQATADDEKYDFVRNLNKAVAGLGLH